MVRLVGLFCLSLGVMVRGPVAVAQSLSTPPSIALIANQACLAGLKDDAQSTEVIRSWESTTSGEGNSAVSRQVIARALGTLNSAGGSGMANLLKGMQFNVRSTVTGGSGNPIAGRVTSDRTVELNGNIINYGIGADGAKVRGLREAYVIHEIGHIAARRLMRFRGPSYEASVPTPCTISTYCTHTISKNGEPSSAHGHRGEEFAEVFSAYVFAGEQLKTQCPQAYAYMQNKVFNGMNSKSLNANQTPSGQAVCTAVTPDYFYVKTDGEIVKATNGVAPKGSTLYVSRNEFNEGDPLPAMNDLISLYQMYIMEAQQAQQYQLPKLKRGDGSGDNETPASKSKGKVKPTKSTSK